MSRCDFAEQRRKEEEMAESRYMYIYFFTYYFPVGTIKRYNWTRKYVQPYEPDISSSANNDIKIQSSFTLPEKSEISNPIYLRVQSRREVVLSFAIELGVLSGVKPTPNFPSLEENSSKRDASFSSQVSQVGASVSMGAVGVHNWVPAARGKEMRGAPRVRAFTQRRYFHFSWRTA